METEASVAEMRSCFTPQEIVPWGDSVAALATLVHSRRIPAFPQRGSIRIVPLAVVYLACKIDFKLFPVYSQTQQVVSL